MVNKTYFNFLRKILTLPPFVEVLCFICFILQDIKNKNLSFQIFTYILQTAIVTFYGGCAVQKYCKQKMHLVQKFIFAYKGAKYLARFLLGGTCFAKMHLQRFTM